MAIGLITGTGTEVWAGFADARTETRSTTYGTVSLRRGLVGTTEVVHISRHGPLHERLSNQIEHRANIVALKDAGVDAVIATTVCGAVEATVALDSVVVFDDFYFPTNRLPGGELCSLYDAEGAPGRGHWIFDRPFCEQMRGAVVAAANDLGLDLVSRGTYGHVDGPRFNSKAEIAALKRAGVAAVSQTAGPEIVLCGEVELPYVLVGYLTDYANGVLDEAMPDEERAAASLRARIERSNRALISLVEAALPRIAQGGLRPGGVVYRFG